MFKIWHMLVISTVAKCLIGMTLKNKTNFEAQVPGELANLHVADMV